MENLKTVSALVKNILEHDHKARNTDNHLYLMVLEHYSGLRGIDIHAMYWLFLMKGGGDIYDCETEYARSRMEQKLGVITVEEFLEKILVN